MTFYKKRRPLLKLGGGVLLFSLVSLIFVLIHQNILDFSGIVTKKTEDNCWNDIDFEKTEKKLLESSIKSKIPFYEYYKNQELDKGREMGEIEESSFFISRKRKHYNKKALFVLFYHNGLKAVFKENNKHKKVPYGLHKSMTAYDISKFLNLRIVPPTVMRSIDEEWGSVQLFVENIKDYPPEHLDNLNSVQKSNLYLFLFLTGNIDPSYNNILISKTCLLPVVADNDSLSPSALIQYGKIPFMGFPIDGKYSVLDRKDYELAPYYKAVPLKSADFETLKALFPGLSFKHINKVRRNFIRNNNISYFRYKSYYFVKYPRDIYKHFLPIKNYSDYSPQTIKKVKLLNEKILKELAIGYLKEDTNFINGVLHRRELFLNEIKKLKEKELSN